MHHALRGKRNGGDGWVPGSNSDTLLKKGLKQGGLGKAGCTIATVVQTGSYTGHYHTWNQPLQQELHQVRACTAAQAVTCT